VGKLFLNLLSTLLILIFTANFQANADELFSKGKEVFLEAGNCAACHSLSDAGSMAEIGPNLNQIRPQLQTILMAVKNGIGVMPAMEGILSDEEIEAVAHYVSIAAEQ
jgi:mono/diheme cytochrome c family protein